MTSLFDYIAAQGFKVPKKPTVKSECKVEKALRAKKYSEVLKPIKAPKDMMLEKRLVSRGCMHGARATRSVCEVCKLPGVVACNSSIMYLVDRIYVSNQKSNSSLIFCKLRNMKYAVITREEVLFESNNYSETVHICEDPYTLIMAYSLCNKDGSLVDTTSRSYSHDVLYDSTCSCQKCAGMLKACAERDRESYFYGHTRSDYHVEWQEGIYDND